MFYESMQKTGCSMRTISLQKSLMFQRFQQTCRHRLLFLACVAAIGKYLCKIFLLVDFHKLLVLLQLFLEVVDDVELIGRIVVICLFMKVRQMGQTVWLFGIFVWHSHCYGRYRKCKTWQMQQVDNSLHKNFIPWILKANQWDIYFCEDGLLQICSVWVNSESFSPHILQPL